MATMQRPADVAVSAPLPQLPAAPPEQTGPGALMPAVVIGIGTVGDRVVRYLRRARRRAVRRPRRDPAPAAAVASTPTRKRPAATGTSSWPGCTGRAITWPSSATAAALDWLPAGLALPPAAEPEHDRPARPGPAGILGPRQDDRASAQGRAGSRPEPVRRSPRPTAAPGSGVRTNRPRVYIVANPAGGTGGGMFVDLAYLARHVLRKLGYTQPDVVGVLLLPPADKGGTRPAALANTYAALAELAHYSRADTTYEAKFGPRDPAVSRPGAAVRPVPVPAVAAGVRTRRRAVTRPGRPPGCCSANCSPRSAAPPTTTRPAPTADAFCHTAATYRLSWPGRRLARRAARRLAASLLRGNGPARTSTPVRPAVTAWLDEQWASRQLAPEQLIDRLTAAAEAAVGGPPDARFDAIVAAAGRADAAEPPLDGRSACLALNDLAELAGKPALRRRRPAARPASEGDRGRRASA